MSPIVRTAAATALLLLFAGAAQGEPIGKTAWELRIQPGQFDSPACVARIASPDLATSLLENRTGEPVMLIARPDWRMAGASPQVTYVIDGEPPRQAQASAVGNLFLLGLKDPAVLERFSRARTIEWELPVGRYRAEVAGLGEAWAAVRACNAKSAAGGAARP